MCWPTCISLHCAIHQQSLAGKFLQSDNTLSTVVKIINKIRGVHNALTHRRFKEFLVESSAGHTDLKLYRGQVAK